MSRELDNYALNLLRLLGAKGEMDMPRLMDAFELEFATRCTEGPTWSRLDQLIARGYVDTRFVRSRKGRSRPGQKRKRYKVTEQGKEFLSIEAPP